MPVRSFFLFNLKNNYDLWRKPGKRLEKHS